jgi:hypothetical protein
LTPPPSTAPSTRSIEFGAAIVGLPAVDTIKQVERTAHGALITSTIPREFVVLAQTPQGFRYRPVAKAPLPRPPPTALSAPTKPRLSSAPAIP